MEIPRPEYPRPQFVRDNWVNLNGQWDFLFDFGNSGRDRKLWENANFSAQDVKQITVPFCPESKLSGIGYTDWMNAVWYRRNFTLSREQLSGRVLLHFGAVDYHSVIYINEAQVGEHKGGYTSFTLDVTDAVRIGENVLTVYAEDDNRRGVQPRGKQSILYNSYSCSYTRTTGIWQTVWLEFVPDSYLTYAKITPFVDEKRAVVEVETMGGSSVTAEASFEGKKMATATAKVVADRAYLVLDLAELHLWDVRQPKLYDLTLSLDTGDKVESYFGMRKVELKKDGLWLNDRPFFMRTILDQGYNPEGVYTGPSDEFLKRDIELAMDLGFNGARFHQRVFEERSLYWADKLGYVIWGEYAHGVKLSDASGISNFLPEWMEAVRRDYSHPSIIGWAPENESYWRKDNNPICQTMFYDVTKQMDPYRPVIDASGGVHWKTDMFDIHDYEQDPEYFKKNYEPMLSDPMAFYNPIHQEQLKLHKYEGQPFWVSEYGGTFWNPNETGGWGYGTPETEEEFAERYEGLTKALLEHPRICGFCYTQLTDVEQEQNGLYKYDRTRKFPDWVYERIRKANLGPAKIEE